ncbi:hypothetical protein SAMN04488020_102244 [Palleronia marisminoris]|uniref:YtxH domain-containing protein n=1 Tax=Palleronia marisminoris TaxID=315423 RepID=A0A1Y5S0A9_9RHOB|nr:hypothetical protein [Palleronia marisminoris]SFG44100.1 hypothetical protein SAMN04488020_102244 [Palleronia marisminoris]SLN26711.1 hypothetical protein PAM7066_01037 [Palleronia marisminoris]
MTPTARNIALAAAATILPAAAAALTYPDRTRRLGHTIGDRVSSLFDDSLFKTDSHIRGARHTIGDRAHDVYDATAAELEDRTRRIMRSLDELAHRLDPRDLDDSYDTPRVSPLTIIGGGIAAALVVPTVLTAIFAPQKLRSARDAVAGYFTSEEEIAEELNRVTDRLNSLSADLDKQRSSNFDDVVNAAKKDD